jgi:hypothetical protein
MYLTAMFKLHPRKITQCHGRYDTENKYAYVKCMIIKEERITN